MISIRKGCFETNSSSMHSLAIWKNAAPLDEYNSTLGSCDKDGVFYLFKYSCDVEDAEYERYPFQILRTSRDKLRYLVGYYCRDGKWKDQNIKKQLTDIVKSHVPDCKKIQWYYQNWNRDKKYAWTAYDNDSGEFPIKFLERKNIPLEDFIFNPKYTIQVDGDEYQTFANMFKSNMIDINNIEDISSGIDYWTDNQTHVWVELLDTEYDDGTSYFDLCEQEIQQVDNIYVSSENATEQQWEKLLKLISKYKDMKNFYIDSLMFPIDEDNVKKYLPDVEHRTQC